MHKKLISLLLIMTVLAAMLSACGQSTAEPAAETEQPEAVVEASAELNYDDIYAPTVEHLWDVAVEGDAACNESYGETAIADMRSYMPTEELLNTVGYTIMDISGDSIPELLIGATGEDNTVYACYTCVDGQPQQTFEGWGRSSHTWAGDGSFAYYGSGGAAYSIFGEHTVSEDGTEVVWKDYYFSWESADGQGLDFYHNSTGYWDPDHAEKLDMTEVDFWKLADEYFAKDVQIDMTPFSEFKTYEAAEEPQEESVLLVKDADDALTQDMTYQTYTADESDSQTHVAFMTNGVLKDFNLLRLNIVDVDENGNVKFAMEELYHLDELTKEQPLAVKMTFFGDSPAYGVSYVDESGTTRYFTVELSGFDGSLITSEFYQ